MADWKTLAGDLALADGKIDVNEVKILKRALFKDGKIDDEEVQFLLALRDRAQKKAKAAQGKLNPAFEKMFFGALEKNVLKDGKIDLTETDWLKKAIFADGKVDAGERAFLVRLKKAAKTRAPEFDAFVDAEVAAAKKKSDAKKAAGGAKPVAKPAAVAAKPAAAAAAAKPAAKAKKK